MARPKGSEGIKEILRAELTAASITEGLLPLEFFLHVLRDPQMPLGFRFEAGKAAAPYVHRRMPIAVEVQETQYRTLDIEDLEGLTDEELEQLQTLMAKAVTGQLPAEKKALTAPQLQRAIAYEKDVPQEFIPKDNRQGRKVEKVKTLIEARPAFTIEHPKNPPEPPPPPPRPVGRPRVIRPVYKKKAPWER